jgi:hypothetical protein
MKLLFNRADRQLIIQNDSCYAALTRLKISMIRLGRAIDNALYLPQIIKWLNSKL